jgi:hypothetical protein
MERRRRSVGFIASGAVIVPSWLAVAWYLPDFRLLAGIGVGTAVDSLSCVPGHRCESRGGRRDAERQPAVLSDAPRARAAFPPTPALVVSAASDTEFNGDRGDVLHEREIRTHGRLLRGHGLDHHRRRLKSSLRPNRGPRLELRVRARPVPLYVTNDTQVVRGRIRTDCPGGSPVQY